MWQTEKISEAELQWSQVNARYFIPARNHNLTYRQYNKRIMCLLVRMRPQPAGCQQLTRSLPLRGSSVHTLWQSAEVLASNCQAFSCALISLCVYCCSILSKVSLIFNFFWRMTELLNNIYVWSWPIDSKYLTFNYYYYNYYILRIDFKRVFSTSVSHFGTKCFVFVCHKFELCLHFQLWYYNRLDFRSATLLFVYFWS